MTWIQHTICLNRSFKTILHGWCQSVWFVGFSIKWCVVYAWNNSITFIGVVLMHLIPNHLWFFGRMDIFVLSSTAIWWIEYKFRLHEVLLIWCKLTWLNTSNQIRTFGLVSSHEKAIQITIAKILITEYFCHPNANGIEIDKRTHSLWIYKRRKFVTQHMHNVSNCNHRQFDR